jgi:hypothetical protein
MAAVSDIPGLVPLEDPSTTTEAPLTLPQLKTGSDIPGLIPPQPPPEPTIWERAITAVKQLPQTVSRDLTPSFPPFRDTPAPGFAGVSPQVVSDPNAYMLRGVRDVADKVIQYPNADYGYVPGQSDLDAIRKKIAADRAAFDAKYSNDPAMPWFRGVGQVAAAAPVVGPLTSAVGAGLDLAIPGAGTFLTGGAAEGAPGLRGIAARTLSRSAAGGTYGAETSALTADPSKPIWPQIQEGGLWGMGTGAALSPVLEGLSKLPTQTPLSELPPVTRSGTSKGIANVAFDRAETLGAGLTPNAVNNAIDDIGKMNVVPADAQSVVRPNDATDMQTRLQTLRDQPLSLPGMKAVVEEIGNQIDAHVQPDGSFDSVGRQLLKMKNRLTDAATNASPGDVTGNPDAFAAWQDGNAAWQTAMQQGQVERIAQWAQGKTDVAQAIKGRVNNMLADADQMRGWSDDAKDALTQVGKTGFVSDFGKTLADRYIGTILMGTTGTTVGGLLAPVLGPLAPLVGGGTGIALQTAVARATRALQEVYTTGQVKNVLKGLGERIRTQQTPGLLGRLPQYGPPPPPNP